MSLFEEIKLYLPHLSKEANEKLFSEIEAFPDNIDKRLYGSLNGDPLQGDGLQSSLVVSLPDVQVGTGPVMVLSNSCDIDPENRRWFPPAIAYCPIVKLSKYIEIIRKHGRIDKEEVLASHLTSIKRQEVSTIFYLPATPRLGEDCIALFDRPNNCDFSFLLENTDRMAKLFTLSTYGFYLFLTKLAIHFTRANEGVDRT
jgi:hypothetical protein